MNWFDKIITKLNDKEKLIISLKEHFTFTFIFFNKKIRSIKYNLYIKNKMEKKIIKFKNLKFPIKSVNPSVKQDETIWVCWFQGIDNAPNIVKICYQSILNTAGTRKVILIDDGNIHKYVDLPDFIIEKRKKKLISDAHFSDLLRIELLVTYGGTWIDATVFIKNYDSLNKIIQKDIFLFSNIMRDTESILFSSWLIHSTRENELLIMTRNSLYGYWLHNKRLNNYFLFHIIISILYSESSVNIPTVSNVPPHILQLTGDNELSEKEIEEIFSESGVQKLSYKVFMNNKNIDYLKNEVGLK